MRMPCARPLQAAILPACLSPGTLSLQRARCRNQGGIRRPAQRFDPQDSAGWQGRPEGVQERFSAGRKGRACSRRFPESSANRVKGERRIIEPKIPKDLDLHALALAGTSVEQVADGEYIVSLLDDSSSMTNMRTAFRLSRKLKPREASAPKQPAIWNWTWTNSSSMAKCRKAAR